MRPTFEQDRAESIERVNDAAGAIVRILGQLEDNQEVCSTLLTVLFRTIREGEMSWFAGLLTEGEEKMKGLLQ